MLSSGQNDEECDARDDDSSNADGDIVEAKAIYNYRELTEWLLTADLLINHQLTRLDRLFQIAPIP